MRKRNSIASHFRGVPDGSRPFHKPLATRALIIVTLTSLVTLRAIAQLDTNLVREIKAWRKGDATPSRLVTFPERKKPASGECGLRVLGSEVVDYIWQIEDADLLAALMFDSRAQAHTFRAAVSRLCKLRGVGHIARLLADKRQTDPLAFTRSELTNLSHLLRSPYVGIKVARVLPEDMEPEKAESALQALKKDLQAGMSWADAYRKHADLHPDLRARAENPRSTRTLVCYHCDGSVSPDGFDIRTYWTRESLPLEHLRELFRAKGGTHIFKGAGGVYLYHIENYYDGRPDGIPGA
jgi:hypothetical protein